MYKKNQLKRDQIWIIWANLNESWGKIVLILYYYIIIYLLSRNYI